jgi:hypothetical protein
MPSVRSALVAIAIAGMITSGASLAQTPAPSPAAPSSTTPSSTPSSSASSKIDDVSKWTSKEWNKAKAKWAQEKEKWADCRKQSKDQKLTGRKSWSFLASCMTS